MNFRAKLGESASLNLIENRNVIFCRRTGSFFGLNESSSFLLKELLKSDFEQAAAAAARHYSQELSQMRTDLRELVAKMESFGLIERIAQ